MFFFCISNVKYLNRAVITVALLFTPANQHSMSGSLLFTQSVRVKCDGTTLYISQLPSSLSVIILPGVLMVDPVNLYTKHECTFFLMGSIVVAFNLCADNVSKQKTLSTIQDPSFTTSPLMRKPASRASHI